MEQLGAAGGAEGVQALLQPVLAMIGAHGREATPSRRRPVSVIALAQPSAWS